MSIRLLVQPLSWKKHRLSSLVNAFSSSVHARAAGVCVCVDTAHLRGCPLHPAFGTWVNVYKNQTLHQIGLIQLKHKRRSIITSATHTSGYTQLVTLQLGMRVCYSVSVLTSRRRHTHTNWCDVVTNRCDSVTPIFLVKCLSGRLNKEYHSRQGHFSEKGVMENNK